MRAGLQARVRRVTQKREHLIARLCASRAARRQGIKDVLQVGWQIVGKSKGFARHRMLKGQHERVEKLPLKSAVCRGIFRRVRRVNGLAHQRMLGVFHVHAYLVRAPSKKLAVDKRIAVVARAVLEAFQHAEGGDGVARRHRARGTGRGL